MVSQQPVLPMIMSRLRNSAMLARLALLFYVPLGILLGVLAALKREKAVDQGISAVTMAFVGLPEFVTGLLLIALFALTLDLLPANSSIQPDATFIEALPYLILPAITVSLTSLGYVARMTRASTIDVLKTDYVRAADLKGLPPATVLFRARAAQLAAADGHGHRDRHRLSDRRPDRDRAALRLSGPGPPARLRHPAPRPHPDPGVQHGRRRRLLRLRTCWPTCSTAC